MATILDAMIVQIVLDPTEFKRGEAEFNQSLQKTKSTSRKAAEDIESAFSKTEKSVTKSTKNIATEAGKATSAIMELTAAFLGGQALKEFIKDSVKANNALGNLGDSLGSSPQLANAFALAAQRMGGSAGTTMASIQGLSDKLVAFRKYGRELPQSLFYLKSSSGKNIDFQHGWEKFALDLATASHELAKTDPGAANLFLREIGLDQVTANLLMRQGPRMREYLETLKKYSANDKDIKASEGLTDSWATLSQQFSLLWTKITTALAPALEWLAQKLGEVIDWVTKWVEKNPGWVEAIAAVLALLSGGAIAAAIASVIGLTTALLGLAGVSLAPLLAGLAALGLTAGGIALMAKALGLFDDDGKSKGGAGGKGGSNLKAASFPAGRVNPAQAAALIRKVGGTENEAAMLGAIAAAESRGDPRAHNTNAASGDNSYGLWQINMLGAMGPKRRAKFGLNRNEDLYDPTTNAMAALIMAREARGYKDWTTFKSGAFLPYLAAARAGARGDAAANPSVTVRDASAPPAPPSLWSGTRVPPSGIMGMRAAALGNINTSNVATTSTSSNEMHINGGIHVNAPNATDATGIGNHIDRALAASMFASFANYGPN